MRPMMLAIALFATIILLNSAISQQPKPSPKTDQTGYGGEHSAKNLTPDTVREISEIERDLERVLDRIAALEVRENEFALERLMIVKAFDQLLAKLRSDSRPKKTTTTAKNRSLDGSAPTPPPATTTDQPPPIIERDGRRNRADTQNEQSHRTKR